MPQLIISKKSNDQLGEISKQRKEDQAVVKTKKGVTEELIDKAHKRECKS